MYKTTLIYIYGHGVIHIQTIDVDPQCNQLGLHFKCSGSQTYNANRQQNTHK